MDDNFGVNLINPFLRMKGRKPKENSIIHLPPLNPPFTATAREFWRTNYEQVVFKATITADPILNPDDCIVVVIYVDLWRLAFIRLNKDISWTYMTKDYTTIEEVAYVDRKFYVVDHRSKLLCFDIAGKFNSDVESIAYGVERNQPGLAKIYLVDSNDGELLLVHRYVDSQWQRRETKKFRVLAFDFATLQWMEKNTLGEVALFLGDNSSMRVSAPRFSGCESDHIYFTDDQDRVDDTRKPRDFGVYNYGNHKFSVSDNSQVMKVMKRTNRYPIWVVPTIYQF
ncbi:PREDICTED: putative F-box protein At5g60060-like [Fragaria vesca subsp. vesca]